MTTFVQLLVAGLAVGLLYALVALGFVVIYKSTGVVNFAQGSLVLLGAYLTYGFHQGAGLPFAVSVLLAVMASVAIALGIGHVVLRPMVGRPVVAVIMITIGLAIVIDEAVIWAWGPDRLSLGDPWGLDTVPLGIADARVGTTDIARVVAATLLLALLVILYRHTRMGLAMRATASDPEAAQAQGVSTARVIGVAWAGAAGIATFAGVFLAAGARGIDPTLSQVGLLAFPAAVLGGMRSTAGAVAGGVVIGVVEVMTAGYGPRHLPDWMGDNLHSVVPYLVLVAVLLIRPSGLFGTAEVRRL
ncbi:MAG: branched-chain amino acid ABC transporter permease [Acidimicrobiales bacterium]